MDDAARPSPEPGGPEDDLRELLRKLLAGEGGMDPAALANAAGMPIDPAMLGALMSQLQSALSNAGDGIDWDGAKRQALAVIGRDPGSVSAEEREAVRSAAHLASLWLDEATGLGSIDEVALLSRQQWAEGTLPVWQQMAEPVAASIADALTDALREQAPEEAREMLEQASAMLRQVGGALFAVQLGQVVGQLAGEVLAGGDIGVPLLDERAALIPANLARFSEGLEIPDDEVRLWIAARELAHARLFQHAKWLRLDVLTQVREYAEGIHIDLERIEELATDFDPQNPEALRSALSDGSLIPPRTEEQEASLRRIETTLALVEGWVDCVTTAATERLPKRAAIAETVRRRRATGGPAEKAFGALVGLEIRPRRLREAAAFWQRVTDAAGAEARDTLWSHPDLVPSADDIADPTRVIAVLRGEAVEPDEVDRALDALLADEGERPQEDEQGGATG